MPHATASPHRVLPCLAALAMVAALGACDDTGRSEPGVDGTLADAPDGASDDLSTTATLPDAADDATDLSGVDVADASDGGADGLDIFDLDAAGDVTPDAAMCGDGVVQPGTEACDIAIPADMPGACPSADACITGEMCRVAEIQGTACQARCVERPVGCGPADGCCPGGCSQGFDVDCNAVCGDGTRDPAEQCDVAIASGDGACPDAVSCAPADACEVAEIEGTGCQATCERTQIVACTNGDGCCASGCTAADDNDCTAACGNGVLEPGEACDTGIASGDGACPTACTSPDACASSMRVGNGCDARCEQAPIELCGSAEGCCPDGCNSGNDADCDPACGNGVLDPGEACDTAIGGGPDACPDAGSCQPDNACQTATLTGASCDAVCTRMPVEVCANGDGCCGPGCNANNDDSCPVVCGNGALETGEQCDTDIPAGDPGACPDSGSCQPMQSCETAVVTGTGCDAVCERTAISACADGDGCCGPMCNATEDSDCPSICGNGVQEPGEDCDEMSATCDPATCTFVGMASGVLINEFRVAPTSEEAVELINGTATNVSLDGWLLRHTDVSGTTDYPVLAGRSVPAAGFVVLTAADLDTGVSGSLFAFTGGVLSLVAPDTTVLDSVAWGTLGDAPAPIFSHTTGRVSDGVDTDVDVLDWNMDPFPTLGSPNDVTPVALGATDVVINEFRVSSLDPNGSYVELYNASNAAVDLRDWILVFGSDEVIFPMGTTIAAGEHLLIEEADFPPFSVLNFNLEGSMYLFSPGWVRVQQLTYGSPTDGPIIDDGSTSYGLSPNGNVVGWWGTDFADTGFGPLTPSPGM